VHKKKAAGAESNVPTSGCNTTYGDKEMVEAAGIEPDRAARQSPVSQTTVTRQVPSQRGDTASYAYPPPPFTRNSPDAQQRENYAESMRDPDLRELVQMWPSLPADTRRSIMTLARHCEKQELQDANRMTG
jgi:hypothetical protein